MKKEVCFGSAVTAAAKFRDAGAGMCGWWAGRGATEDEPGGAYGVMMRVAPEHGRYVGTSFSARELATMQERNARRARAGGSSDKTSDTTPAGDDDDAFGRRVFELWLERDETTGEYVARRAVRFDGVVAAGLGGELLVPQRPAQIVVEISGQGVEALHERLVAGQLVDSLRVDVTEHRHRIAADLFPQCGIHGFE